jgi:hypothetical protein
MEIVQEIRVLGQRVEECAVEAVHDRAQEADEAAEEERDDCGAEGLGRLFDEDFGVGFCAGADDADLDGGFLVGLVDGLGSCFA